MEKKIIFYKNGKEKMRMKNKIAIWGAGKFGQYICEQLKRNQNIEIVCFVDKNDSITGTKIADIGVIQPKQLDDYKERLDAVLVAFVGALGVHEEFASYKGIRFGFVDEGVLAQEWELDQDIFTDDNIFWLDDCSRPMLRNLETNVVDYCNLNCKGCSHFSNLYKKGDMVTFESYCRDLEQIAAHINVRRFNLLGGEALLHERLTDYMVFARKVMPNTQIWVITNGLLLVKQKEDFFRCCIDNRIGIDISEYEPTSKIINEIVQILEKYNLKYNIRDNKGDFGKNIDLLGRAIPNEAMKHCRESSCHFFRNGKLYKCPFEALGNKFFQHYRQDTRLNGGTNLFDDNLDWRRLTYQLENEPVAACVYCGEEVRYTWEVSHNPVMEEWIIN